MDTSHDAFEELSILKAVRPLNEYYLLVDRERLADLGYVLVLWHNEPTFHKLSDVQRYTYNPVLYLDDVVPRSALKSYTTIKLKEDYSSY